MFDQKRSCKPPPRFQRGLLLWSLTQAAVNNNLNALAAKLAVPKEQLQISALGTGDGSSARFPSIYQDLFGNRTFDNSKSSWSYDWSGSGGLPAFTG